MTISVQNIESKVSTTESVIAGAFAGGITRALAQPLDVLKIRFQLQLEPFRNGSKYSSILQALRIIIKEEGLTTLWSGHIPAQLLSVTYGMVQFASYEKLTQICVSKDPQFYFSNKHWINFSNGSIAATAAIIASYPFDTVRTRLVAEQKTSKVYRGFTNAFKTIVRTEGPFALFKGIVPTIAQVGPQAGITFAVYKLFTENILSKINFFQRSTNITSVVESTLIANFLAGGIAGFVAKTVIYPFDVIKKRLQIQGFQQHRSYFGKQIYCSGTIHCIKLTLSEEGFLALYKGYSPSILKAVLTTALHFAVYDEIKHLILRFKV